MQYRRTRAHSVELAGDDRDAFLQGQCTNDIRNLGVGQFASAACLTPKGKVLFLFRVAKAADRLRLLLEGPRSPELTAHFKRFAVFTKVAVADVKEDFSRFDLYDTTTALTPPDFAQVWPTHGEIQTTWLVPVSRSEETARLLASRAEPIANAAAERLRIGAGRPAWGTDFDETFLFDELAMPEAVSYTKGCYVGQEIVARVKTYGQVQRRLVRFEFSGGPPEAGTAIARPGEPDRELGRVTSVSGELGLGTARREVADGDTVALVGNGDLTARVLPRVPA